ncbi:MAG: Gx transporter family protein [Frisingicoccus sp.]|uniref:Gx transporter family protein n=1 Tax=Frisingicoccus sp. TaxID=1918627 RepID=UPI002A801F92|nr:Gx transporter family protein [Frisingicoccus sp.]MDY4834257.1 Gx transporter family protein [Frisingicoccus sp.]
MSKKVAMAGMFTALAMIFSYVEVLIPINLGIPGMKLGLANLVVVVTLYTMGAPMAFAVSMIRIMLVSMTFGSFSAMLYSMAGGLLSFCGMALLKKIPNFSVIGVSLLGGVLHNTGQLLVAMAVVENINLIAYLPPLMIAGMVTGILIGIVSAQVIPRIKRVLYSGA